VIVVRKDIQYILAKSGDSNQQILQQVSWPRSGLLQDTDLLHVSLAMTINCWTQCY